MIPTNRRKRNAPDVVIERRSQVQFVLENVHFANSMQDSVLRVKRIQNIPILGNVQQSLTVFVNDEP